MGPHDLDDETLAALTEGRLPAAQALALRKRLEAEAAGAELLDLLSHLDRLTADASRLDAHPVPRAVTRSAIDLWPEVAAPARAAAPVAASVVLADRVRIAVRWLGEQLAPLRDALTPEAAGWVPVRGAAALGAEQPLGPAPTDEAAPPAPREEWRWRVQLGAFALTLDLEVDGPRQVALTVRPDAPLPAGTLLRLTQGTETRALSTLGLGGTTVNALEAGTYALTLEGEDREIGRLPIDLQAEPAYVPAAAPHKNAGPPKKPT